MSKLPPLPASYMQDPRYGMSNEPAYTADQMNAHALATWNAAIEAAAKACEAKADPIDDGWDQCLDECASAIRSMKEHQ